MRLIWGFVEWLEGNRENGRGTTELNMLLFFYACFICRFFSIVFLARSKLITHEPSHRKFDASHLNNPIWYKKKQNKNRTNKQMYEMNAFIVPK